MGKYCFVPLCKNTSYTTPGKIFVTVPLDEGLRVKWFRAVGRAVKTDPASMKYIYSCCEDHFDVEKEFINLRYYRLVGGKAEIKLKPGTIPSKFDCQPLDTRPQEEKKPRFSARKKRKKPYAGDSEKFKSKKIVNETGSSHIADKEKENEEEDMIDFNAMIPEIQMKSEPTDEEDFQCDNSNPPNSLDYSGHPAHDPLNQNNSVIRPRDEFDVFGEEVAIRVRQMATNFARSTVILKIQTVLYEGSIGTYDEPKPERTNSD